MDKYIDYERFKAKYQTAQEKFAEILLEKERLFTQTLPNAITYDKDQVAHTVDGNPLERYILSLEEENIEAKLARYRRFFADWDILIEVKEKELRQSKSIMDRIYVMKILDGYGIGRICKEMHYSKAQVYKKMEVIRKNLKT